jgi:hypothetical protein
MIAPPPSVQIPADLMLYAGLTIAAGFGIGLIALGIRLAIRRDPEEPPTI